MGINWLIDHKEEKHTTEVQNYKKKSSNYRITQI